MISDLFADYIAVLIATILGFVLVGRRLHRQPHPLSAPEADAKGDHLRVRHAARSAADRTQIHFRYYLFAILFLIFDIEAVFLFPWAVTFVEIGEQAFWEMVVFILILGFGLLYAWKKGVLQVAVGDANDWQATIIEVYEVRDDPQLSIERRRRDRRSGTRIKTPRTDASRTLRRGLPFTGRSCRGSCRCRPTGSSPGGASPRSGR